LLLTTATSRSTIISSLFFRKRLMKPKQRIWKDEGYIVLVQWNTTQGTIPMYACLSHLYTFLIFFPCFPVLQLKFRNEKFKNAMCENLLAFASEVRAGRVAQHHPKIKEKSDFC
jgi:hypothetical protein